MRGRNRETVHMHSNLRKLFSGAVLSYGAKVPAVQGVWRNFLNFESVD